MVKMKKNRKEGFVLIELICAISISLVIIFGVQYSYNIFKEKVLIVEATIKIVRNFNSYRDLAYYKEKSYNIEVNGREKRLVFKLGASEVKRVELPKELRYKLSILRGYDRIDTWVTRNGNLGHSFSIYIFGKSNIAKYRISFYTFSKLRYLSINLYKNIRAKEATYSNILNYHKTQNAINHVGWKKE